MKKLFNCLLSSPVTCEDLSMTATTLTGHIPLTNNQIEIQGVMDTTTFYLTFTINEITIGRTIDAQLQGDDFIDSVDETIEAVLESFNKLFDVD